MNSTDLWILWRPPQSLTREPYIVASTKVSVLGIDVDAICADSLGIASILLLVFLGLSMQVGKAVPHRNTNLPQAEALWARAPNSTAALALPRTIGRTCL